MLSLERDGFNREEVLRALTSENRLIDFRYELLDSENTKRRDLDEVTGGAVEHDTLASIKRTAKFDIRDNGGIDFASNRIKPWAMLEMPNGRWVSWPLGVFILITPNRKAQLDGSVLRNIEAYDLSKVLADFKFDDRFIIKKGEKYTAKLGDLFVAAGIPRRWHNITDCPTTAPEDRDWPPEDDSLKIANEILGAINYRSLFFDGEYAVAVPYIAPDQRASEHVYADDEWSVIFPEVDQDLDYFNVPNRIVLFVSEPDRKPIRSVWENLNPNSPTSYPNRKRWIVKKEAVEAPNQATLDAMAARMGQEVSQIFEIVNLETAIMPFHADADVYTLRFSALGIDHKYSETAWGFDLSPGAKMRHSIRRVVSV